MLLTEMSSYNNAVQQYGKDVADFWSQFDFSSTKRYVKKRELYTSWHKVSLQADFFVYK